MATYEPRISCSVPCYFPVMSLLFSWYFGQISRCHGPLSAYFAFYPPHLQGFTATPGLGVHLLRFQLLARRLCGRRLFRPRSLKSFSIGDLQMERRPSATGPSPNTRFALKTLTEQRLS
jgi:hypothetical protein